jgi:hypothetical protein
MAIRLAAFLLCSALFAQDLRTFILAASQSGNVEFIDPATLDSVGRIHFDLGLHSAGLNGVSASADGTALYVEAPAQNKPSACCVVFSVDLATLQMKQVGSISGTRSKFFGVPVAMAQDRLLPSGDRHWIFGVSFFQGYTVDIYDAAAKQIIRRLTPQGLTGNWWPAGVWAGDQFYLYAANSEGAALLWTISPETTELGTGLPVAPFGQVTGCSDAPRSIVASAGNVFLYEDFGFKVDRRNECAGPVQGGAWLVDTSTGKLIRQIAPEVHFSELLSNPASSQLYGLSVEDVHWGSTRLVQIDSSNGAVLKSRPLDPGFWRVAIAPVRLTPSGEVTYQTAQSAP